MISSRAAQEFLDLPRLAVVGASADQRKFGNAVYRALRDSGRSVVAVNPGEDVIAGDPCYRSVAEVPDGVDGAIVMTSSERSADAVRACLDAGIRQIWLFKGLGGPGSASEEALRLCASAGATTIEGACPFMFLQPVGAMHVLHRAVRQLKGDVAA